MGLIGKMNRACFAERPLVEDVRMRINIFPIGIKSVIPRVPVNANIFSTFF